MQKIAFENNLSETAFFINEGEQFSIKWFTPTTEVDLCGHATLASAFVLYNFYNYDKNEILFDSNSGILKVTKKNFIILNFPAEDRVEVETPSGMILGLGSIVPTKVFKAKDDFIAVLDTEKEVQNLIPDFDIKKK